MTRRHELVTSGWRLQMRLLAQILAGMANENMTVERMALRLGCKKARISKFLRVPERLKDRPLGMRDVSDALLALGCELELNAKDRPARMVAGDLWIGGAGEG